MISMSTIEEEEEGKEIKVVFSSSFNEPLLKMSENTFLKGIVKGIPRAVKQGNAYIIDVELENTNIKPMSGEAKPGETYAVYVSSVPGRVLYNIISSLNKVNSKLELKFGKLVTTRGRTTRTFEYEFNLDGVPFSSNKILKIKSDMELKVKLLSDVYKNRTYSNVYVYGENLPLLDTKNNKITVEKAAYTSWLLHTVPAKRIEDLLSGKTTDPSGNPIMYKKGQWVAVKYKKVNSSKTYYDIPEMRIYSE